MIDYNTYILTCGDFELDSWFIPYVSNSGAVK